MPSTDPRIVKLTVECIDLPPHNWGGHSQIWLGIQSGKDVVQRVKLPAETVNFEAELRVSESPQGGPNFLGPYAQGTAQERFFYLNWGFPLGTGFAGFRRAKIPLMGLTWDDLKSNHVHVKIRCTDVKGGPVCATLKGDFVTWSAPDN